ncbi:Uncharacterised protein [Zhongshania aliphaticivorans]|uniref:Uncharacterized protein n=1 Tax=Zhongshania aliphaticivorans TaxID=1470434 RepID=A0A5S9NMK7_9GAMM|nr:hypothetical protein [Zhongshania aliphaticivorans]CAA0091523.1 Uncharacterised protein [Zhongshania aliphaticivorans]
MSKTLPIFKTVVITGITLMSGITSAGLLSTLSDVLSNPSVDRSVTIEKCVELPASDTFFAGIATPLTGPIGLDLPSTGKITVCAATSCDVTGGIEMTPEAPSFSDCDLGYSLSGSGEGSCVTTLKIDTLLGEKTIYADRSASIDGYPVFPLEVCLAKTSD